MEAQQFIVRAMSYSKAKFIDAIRGDLTGAFGEFMCRRIALEIGKPDDWSKEIANLAKLVPAMMAPTTKVAVKRKDDCLREALSEAYVDSPRKVVFAKNKVSGKGYYPSLARKIQRLDFDAHKEFVSFVEEFLPEYKHLLQ